MSDEKEIYQSHADQYDRLVMREDYLNQIPIQIDKIRPVDGLNIIELGMGTGRLTRVLSQRAKFINACDSSFHMLTHAAQLLTAHSNITYCLADMRLTPFKAHQADLVLAGWSFCYLAVWNSKHWRAELERGIVEIRRLLKSGGTAIFFENFGTGFYSPNPPAHLKEYFKFLDDSGFQSGWFRTDYRFKSIQEAVELSGLFFGENLAEKIKAQQWTVLPECTAIYWLTF